MEFNEKLQDLRKKKGITQEELAKAIFVSRTAVSKWESGRGYPNIDSLKAIALYFSVSLDELLSSSEVNTIEKKEKRLKKLRDPLFALSDISTLLLLFLPIFAERRNGYLSVGSLLSLDGIKPYLKISYIVMISLVALFGILTLLLQECRAKLWNKSKSTISSITNALLLLFFIISLQPYPAVYMLVLLVIKRIYTIKCLQ